MDNFVEQVVKKEKNVKYYLTIVLIILAALAIPTTLVILAEIIKRGYLIYIALFLLMFCIYGAWYFISSLRVEYEYALLSSTFKVDKIIAKRKRRKILTVDVKTFDDLFPYDDKQMNAHRFTKVYDVAAKTFSKDNYVASFHSEAKGKCGIIFTPKQELLAGMKPYLDSKLKAKIYKEKLF